MFLTSAFWWGVILFCWLSIEHNHQFRTKREELRSKLLAATQRVNDLNKELEQLDKLPPEDAAPSR